MVGDPRDDLLIRDQAQLLAVDQQLQHRVFSLGLPPTHHQPARAGGRRRQEEKAVEE